eukprot:860254_1
MEPKDRRNTMQLPSFSIFPDYSQSNPVGDVFYNSFCFQIYYRLLLIVSLASNMHPFVTHVMDLNELQSNLEKHLSEESLYFLRSNIDHSLCANHIAQAIVMLLGHPYPTTTQCQRALQGRTTIENIKNLHHKRISITKKIQIRSWMLTKPETFAKTRGYFGCTLFHILKDWAIYIVQSDANTQHTDDERHSVRSSRNSCCLCREYSSKAIRTLLDEQEHARMKKNGKLKAFYFGKDMIDI